MVVRVESGSVESVGLVGLVGRGDPSESVGGGGGMLVGRAGSGVPVQRRWVRPHVT